MPNLIRQISDTHESLLPAEVRRKIRAGELTGPTTGYSAGFMQANLAILPENDAADFLRYCARNPKSCPILAIGEPGNPLLETLGSIDIRTDIARYRIFRDGQHAESVTDVSAVWRDDLVTFVLGCSFSFESALVRAGIPVRHIEGKRNVPMYVTNIKTQAAGKFSGPLVVSMRGFSPADSIQAIVLSERYPLAHGTPVHIGNPQEIGITDLLKPDFGDTPILKDGDIPVFWACGVTPQMAIRNARPDLAITHEPGHMLVTDMLSEGARTGIPPR